MTSHPQQELTRLVRQLRDAILTGTAADRWAAVHDSTAYLEGAPAAPLPKVYATHYRCDHCRRYREVRRFPLANPRKDGTRGRFHYCRDCLISRRPTPEEQLAVKRARGREHMRRKRQDPAYRERERVRSAAYVKRRTANPEYRERHRAYMRGYNVRVAA